MCVPAGPVILESPALPVTEGDNVTLTCRHKDATSACALTADFYKDGSSIGTSSTGVMSLGSVTPSDEGLYKCKVCGLRESPESWLTVRGERVVTRHFISFQTL